MYNLFANDYETIYEIYYHYSYDGDKIDHSAWVEFNKEGFYQFSRRDDEKPVNVYAKDIPEEYREDIYKVSKALYRKFSLHMLKSSFDIKIDYVETHNLINDFEHFIDLLDTFCWD